MLSPKMMQNLTKMISQTTKSMTSQNKVQSIMLGDLGKAFQDSKSGGGISKAMKDISATLLKTSKLIEAQTTLLTGVKPDDLAEDGDDKDAADKAKELDDTVKKITDENKKQAAEIDSLLAEIDKAAKEASDDKDASKKIKTATAALEKAVKLIDEQSKLLDEARKALAA